MFPVLICWTYYYDEWIKVCLNQVSRVAERQGRRVNPQQGLPTEALAPPTLSKKLYSPTVTANSRAVLVPITKPHSREKHDSDCTTARSWAKLRTVYSYRAMSQLLWLVTATPSQCYAPTVQTEKRASVRPSCLVWWRSRQFDDWRAAGSQNTRPAKCSTRLGQPCNL